MSDSGSGVSLASVLCARLCHDLSSPLGTLCGTLELMAEDAESTVEALPLAGDIARTMTARLRLLRAAWAGGAGSLTPVELARLAEGLPERVRVDASRLAGPSFAAPAGRVLLNLLLLAAESLPRGGTVALAGEPGDVVVLLDGPAAAWPASLPGALAGTPPALEPRTVLATLVPLLAAEAGLRLSFLMAPGAPVAAPPLRLAPA